MKHTVVILGMIVLIATQLGLAHQGVCSQLMTVATPSQASHCAHKPAAKPVQQGCDDNGCRQLCRSASSLIPVQAKKYAFEPILAMMAVNPVLEPDLPGDPFSTLVVETTGPPGLPPDVFLLNEAFLF